MKITRVLPEDSILLATLHIKSLPDTISSKIGPFYLERIYKSIAKNSQTHLLLKAVDDDKIVGAVCATSDLKRFQKDVKRQLSLKDYTKIFFAVISFRITIIDLLRRIRFEESLNKSYNKNYCSIVIFFVNEDFRRKGIGSLLIKRVLSVYQGKVENIYVDTLISNKTAIRFYQSLGFKQVKNIDDSTLMLFTK